jgi:SAM-dependent methyltransferase
MPDAEAWLQRIAQTAGTADLPATYDDWAVTYDADAVSVGYAPAAVVAGLIARNVAPGARVLDAGAGTGLLGAILHPLRYVDLVALDASPGMLARARQRGIYRELHVATLGDSLGFADDAFDAAAAVGVFAMGHAPARTLDELVRVTRPGGIIAFNVNLVPWKEAGFEDRVSELTRSGRWEPADESGLFAPMPLSPTRGDVRGRAFAFRVRA